MCRGLLRFSVGKKAAMALTGLVLLGFVIVHLAGNLLVFAGPEALNAYAAKLRHLGALLWAARLVLAAAVVIHIWLSVVLSRENRAARPIGYARQQLARTTLGARTMMLSGILLLVFLIYHLLHFTFRVTHPDISHLTDALGRHDVYSMVVLSFQDPLLVAAYVVAMALLCLHLSHGIASWCQSLGLNNERTLPLTERAGRLMAWAIFLGYSSIPVSIYAGFVKPGGLY